MDIIFEIFSFSSPHNKLALILVIIREEKADHEEKCLILRRNYILRFIIIRINSFDGHQHLFFDYFIEPPSYPLKVT